MLEMKTLLKLLLLLHQSKEIVHFLLAFIQPIFSLLLDINVFQKKKQPFLNCKKVAAAGGSDFQPWRLFSLCDYFLFKIRQFDQVFCHNVQFAKKHDKNFFFYMMQKNYLKKYTLIKISVQSTSRTFHFPPLCD